MIKDLINKARKQWTVIKNERNKDANTAERIGKAGLALADAIENTSFSEFIDLGNLEDECIFDTFTERNQYKFKLGFEQGYLIVASEPGGNQARMRVSQYRFGRLGLMHRVAVWMGDDWDWFEWKYLGLSLSDIPNADFENCQLLNPTDGSMAYEWNTGYMFDDHLAQSANFKTRKLYGFMGDVAYDWERGLINDIGGVLSINAHLRRLESDFGDSYDWNSSLLNSNIFSYDFKIGQFLEWLHGSIFDIPNGQFLTAFPTGGFGELNHAVKKLRWGDGFNVEEVTYDELLGATKPTLLYVSSGDVWLRNGISFDFSGVTSSDFFERALLDRNEQPSVFWGDKMLLGDNFNSFNWGNNYLQSNRFGYNFESGSFYVAGDDIALDLFRGIYASSFGDGITFARGELNHANKTLSWIDMDTWDTRQVTYDELYDAVNSGFSVKNPLPTTINVSNLEQTISTMNWLLGVMRDRGIMAT